MLADCSVELIPPEIRRHPAVLAYCKRRRKDPEWTILDSSYHYPAMRSLRDHRRRGRPDILHFTALESLESPLSFSGLLELHCHTLDGRHIWISSETRLPRVYERFKGLLEQLYKVGEIRTEDGKLLLRIEQLNLSELVKRLSPDAIYLLSERGRLVDEYYIRRLVEGVERPMFIAGCFPHGDFSEEVYSLEAERLSVSPHRLPAWIAVSRLLCMVELAVLRRV